MKRTKSCRTCLGNFYDYEYMRNGECWMCLEGKDDEMVERKSPVQMISLIELRETSNNFNPIAYEKQCKRSEEINN